MITLRQLTHARTLAQVSNFHHAAKVLHITQPALSRSIQALEAALGVQLFNRLAMGVELTRFGEAFLLKAHMLLQVHDDLTREMKVLKALEQVDLAIAMGPYAYDLHGPAVMAGVGSAHPGLQCRLLLGDWREVITQVLGRDVDLGVGDVAPAAGDARLDTELVGQHAVHFYCRADHPILGRGELTLEDLADTVLVGTRASVRLGAVLVKLGGRAGVLDKTTGDFVPAWEVNDIHASKHMVASSDAIGAAMLTQIRHELDTGALCLLPIHTPWLRLNYGFIRRRDSATSAGALKFMAAFRERETALSTQEAELRRRFNRSDPELP
jgi:DNA-binding transcriptional LysR family regulator